MDQEHLRRFFASGLKRVLCGAMHIVIMCGSQSHRSFPAIGRNRPMFAALVQRETQPKKGKGPELHWAT